jgi:hypothetical protein
MRGHSGGRGAREEAEGLPAGFLGNIHFGSEFF